MFLYFYQYAKYWLYMTYFFFYSLLFDIEAPSVVDPPEKILYDRELERFRLYEKNENIELCERNRSIEAFYYDKVQYKKVFEDPKNEHEVNWRRKILYMTTPLGNIAMFFDPFKLGFSYYADQSYIKYDILNAMAMKYVIMFRCWDFFMDELVVREPRSPLIKVHLVEEVKPNPYIPKKIENSPFAKFKKNEIMLSTILKNKTSLKSVVEKDKNRNKFLYLGKIQNMNFIQPLPKIRRILPIFKSNLLECVEKNAAIQSECLSYKEYITMKQQLSKE